MLQQLHAAAGVGGSSALFQVGVECVAPGGRGWLDDDPRPFSFFNRGSVSFSFRLALGSFGLYARLPVSLSGLLVSLSTIRLKEGQKGSGDVITRLKAATRRVYDGIYDGAALFSVPFLATTLRASKQTSVASTFQIYVERRPV